MSGNNHSNTTRREFMRNTGAALAAVTVASAPRTVRAEGDVLRIGLIGCGGRGSGAANEALQADPKNKLVALADFVPEQMEECLKKFSRGGTSAQVDVPKERMFAGIDGYKGVIANCDVVILATAPAFRPAHLRAAVEAGKHIFCEKPIAVDPTGVRHVAETCEMAKEKKLNIVSGLCYRYENAKRETIKRIQDGAVGEILAMQTTYNTGGLWHKGHKPEWSELDYQIRNWLYFDWLSGDHIVEQHIHSLDKILWVMGDKPPAKATGSGGRVQRTDAKYGNIYDHFNTVYEWENGLKAFSSCRQWNDCSTNVSDYIIGTKGTAELQSHSIRATGGGESWHHKKESEDNMYQNEHNALFKAIRSGEVINNGDYMCKSTLMAIMGRLAAYTGKTLTWDEIWNSKLNLMPENLEDGAKNLNPVAVPGAYKI